MFQDKNTNNKQPDFNSSLAPMSPIHLMKTDLEEIKNPKKEMSKNSSEPMRPIVNLSEKQKTSPFFNATKPQEIVDNKPKEDLTQPTPRPAAESTPFVFSSPKEPVQEIRREAPQKIETSVFSQPKNTIKDLPKKSAENFALNKIVMVFAVFFFLLVVGASGYYFWIVRQTDIQPENNQTTTEQLESQSMAQESEIKPEKLIEFSTEKPNYFPIDIATADKNSIIAQIDTYIKRAEDLEIVSPVEIIFTDSANNPLIFKIFAGKIGLTLSDQILAALKDNFSLFIYNDNNNYRLGIIIDSANDLTLKSAMLKEEPNLITALAPILKNPENKNLLKEEKYFQNTYKDISIRYANIVSPEYLSIDYAVFQKKLVIVTTKNMSRVIIDYLTPVPAKTSLSNSVKISESETPTKTIQDTATTNSIENSDQE